MGNMIGAQIKEAQREMQVRNTRIQHFSAFSPGSHAGFGENEADFFNFLLKTSNNRRIWARCRWRICNEVRRG
jgi:hypothetical protein